VFGGIECYKNSQNALVLSHTCLVFWSRMWYMSCVLVQNVVHVLCSAPECGTCLTFWSRMWYMSYVVVQNVVQVSLRDITIWSVSSDTCIEYSSYFKTLNVVI